MMSYSPVAIENPITLYARHSSISFYWFIAFQALVKDDNPDLTPKMIVNQLNHYRRPYEASLN